MLSINVASEAISLTDELVKIPAAISAMPGSPLSQLVDACLNSDFVIKGKLDKDAFSPSIINELSMVKNNDGKSEHDLVKAEVIDPITSVIQLNKDMVKNKAIPLITSVKKRFDELATGNSNDFIANIAVVQEFKADVWHHPALDSLIEQYPEAALKTLFVTKPLGPVMTAEQIAVILETGIADFDHAVKQALAVDNNPQLAYNVYTTYFSEPTSDTNFANIFNAYLKHHLEGLVAFLIARYFSLNVPSGINYESTEYNAFITDVVLQGANCIRNIGIINANEIKQKNLLSRDLPFISLKNASQTNKIFVNGAVYNTWLKEGGTPEILMGAVIEGDSVNYSDLIANGVKYTNSYNYYVTIRSQALKEKRLSFLIDAFGLTINEYIQELGDTENNATKIQMQTVFEGIFSKLTEASFDESYELIRTTVCDVFFAHTDVKVIIEQMDLLCDKYPDKSINEIATLALMDYIVYWVLQFVVVKRLG